MSGKLFIITGPMFSGKTTYLINKSLNIENKLLINSALDVRYKSNMISSHEGIHISCNSLDKLSKIKNLENYKTVKNIFIDEAQFFADLKDIVLDMVNSDKKCIYIAGLTTDHKQDKFGELSDLMCFADEIKILQGKCFRCNEKSIFTKKITVNTEEIIDVGSENKYESLCRNCI
jgi:thymidine kinase